MAETFFAFDRSAEIISGLHQVRGTGLGELCGWRSWEIASRYTSRATPQQPVRPKKFMIPPNRAADWNILDMRVSANDGRRELMLGAGQGVPGEMFSSNQLDNALAMPAVAAQMTIEVDVEYVGGNPDGDVFYAAFVCDTVDERTRKGSLVTIPITSSQTRIVPAARAQELGPGKRIGIQIDDSAWVFRQDRRETPWGIHIEGTDLRREQPTMDEVLYLDTDTGNGEVMRIGDPKPVGTKGIRRPASVPFKPDTSAIPDRPRFEVPELWAVRPRVLSLHVIEKPLRVLFGLDETTNQVVFEIAIGGDTPVYARGPHPGDGSLFGRFARNGYTPSWWDQAALAIG